LFVSHAYPEDNAFAGWLADRLAVEGYETWIDLQALKGGERIWPEVELAVRENAFRFLYVLSATSNAKDGTLQELELARKVAATLGCGDFVIPLVIDDLRPSDFNIRLTQLRPIIFSSGWAAGLSELLAKLESVNAPRTTSPEAAARAWRVRMSGAEKISQSPERLYTNLLPLRHIPSRMFSFPISDGADVERVTGEAACPLVVSGNTLYSFEEDPSLIHPSLRGPRVRVETAASRPHDEPGRSHFDALTALIRTSWECALLKRGLRLYPMANKRRCLFFPVNLAPNRVHFATPDITSWRSLTGVSRGAYWHFGMTAYVRDFGGLNLAIGSHVVSSDDGITPWSSDTAQHRARRRIAKNWWNDRWRDLLLAAASWMAEDGEAISFEVAAGEQLEIAATPKIVEAPFRFEHDPSSAVGARTDEERPRDDAQNDPLDEDDDDLEANEDFER
jgi:hypothetical protein